MLKKIIYNSVLYSKHPKQDYFYCAQSIGKRQYSRSLHRQMWFDKYGEIPEGFHIHHKNEDAFDNRIDNFELINGSDHASLHSNEKVLNNPERFQQLAATGREYAKEWHKSDEGREWHKQNALEHGFGQMEYGTKECDYCNNVFMKKTAGSKFCSNKCKSAWRRKNNPDKKMVNCLTCGVEFETLKYLPKKYCSSKCRPAPNPNGGRRKK